LALRPGFDLSARFHNVVSSGFSISKPIDCCLFFSRISILPVCSD
jgi:hypothetical protein